MDYSQGPHSIPFYGRGAGYLLKVVIGNLSELSGILSLHVLSIYAITCGRTICLPTFYPENYHFPHYHHQG